MFDALVFFLRVLGNRKTYDSGKLDGLHNFRPITRGGSGGVQTTPRNHQVRFMICKNYAC